MCVGSRNFAMNHAILHAKHHLQVVNVVVTLALDPFV